MRPSHHVTTQPSLAENLNRQEAWRYSQLDLLRTPQWHALANDKHLPIVERDESCGFYNGRWFGKSPSQTSMESSLDTKPSPSVTIDPAIAGFFQQFYRQGLTIVVKAGDEASLNLHHHWDGGPDSGLLKLPSETSPMIGNCAAYSLHIRLEDNAKLTLDEEFWGDILSFGQQQSASLDQRGYGWILPIYRIELGHGAKLLWRRMAEQDHPHHSLSAQAEITQARNSQLCLRSWLRQSSLHRLALDVDLIGEEAVVDLGGATYGVNTGQIDHQIAIHHRASHTCSKQLFHSLVADQALGIFHGLIDVRPKAKSCVGHQTHKALLWDESASLFARPSLMIENDDVVCSHGFACGTLDPAQLFYLQARGIKSEDAHSMLREAFLLAALEGDEAIPLRQRFTSHQPSLLEGW